MTEPQVRLTIKPLAAEQFAAEQCIAEISLENQQRLNIINSRLMQDLIDAFEQASKQHALRAIILRGAGDKAFIGGADIREMVDLDPDSAEQFITKLHQVCSAVRNAPVPVIAAIRGYCLGAGLEVAAACDLRIAADNAQFGMPEVNVGLPSVIEAALLPRLIGWGRCARLLYTGELIDAQTALHWGLIEEQVELDQLASAQNKLISAISGAGAHAIRAQKALLRQWEQLALDAAIEQGIQAFRTTYHSDEPQIMMQRFLQRKRR